MSKPVNSEQYSVFSKKTEYKKLFTIHYSLFTVYCLLFTVYCLLNIGCGHKPPTLSDTHLKAIDFNQRAEHAFKKGDYKKALNFYHEALKVNRSVENIDGIAINLMNMATVYRKLGDKDNAHKCVDEILNSSGIIYSSLRLTDASFMKALLFTDDGKYDPALEWTDKAISFCKSAGCHMEGSIYNLKAKMYLLNKDPNSAIIYGNKGLELNRKYDDVQEIANSLRLIAEAKTSLNQFEEAIKLYEDALSMDKALGLSKKIAIDLMGIGNIFLKQGKCEDALKYYQRAHSAGESAGDQQVVKDASNMMDKCLQK
ncbi:MAG: tetratricopeptide repeat protein [Nitrospira sp.]|nr:tetratricopeptide repeat protein [Nitrospira sp.]